MGKFITSKTASIEDIIAMNALYRPGPMDYIPEFIENRKHPENIIWDSEMLKPILSSTYGVIVYQGATCSQLKRLSKI